MGVFIKRYDDLTITDDFLFCRILEKNPDLCQDIVERIIGRKIGRIVRLEGQKEIRITPDGRGIRLDVYFEDDAENVYDIEMQTAHYDELPQRIRYYQGTIDQDLINKGKAYSSLKDCWIIFICKEDIFHLGQGLYSFSLHEDHNHQLILDDKAHRLIFCLNGYDDDFPKQQRELADAMTGRNRDTPLGRRLTTEESEARHSAIWREQYMKYEYDLHLAREDGKKELALAVLNNLTASGMPLAEAERMVGMTMEEAKTILQADSSDTQQSS